MSSYATLVTCGDFGPWISKVVLDLPCEVRASEVVPAGFNVFCERFEPGGEPLMRKERGADRAVHSAGYVPVLAAYPCDERGERVAAGAHVALEVPETRLTKRIEGGVLGSRYIENRLRVTQLAPLGEGGDPVCGLVFDEPREEYVPALAGWKAGVQAAAVDGIALEYGYFEPSFEPRRANPFAPPAPVSQKAPLIVYLHGAGEGRGETQGEGPARAYTGNRVTALSQDPVQGYFGGAAWVLVPQSPTFWMDNGVEQMGRSNQSIYAPVLKALIDEFVAAHAEHVDTSRIVIAGLSNGGFMTLRMCRDYPGFFAAAAPCCAPWYDATDEDVAELAKTPLWFTHSKGDELVDPRETVLPLYAALKASGADVHCTYFDHVEDLTGRYREPDGSPKRTFNHGVWIHQFKDFCRTDMDGRNVRLDGEPVGLWEWCARVSR
ncbi:MAG: prolyl oligopeptidase family serine peptidase [Coriobacteriia bacterium]|nr:prolyl oligopeptidase family serine peptidase [Coriobacteriia bacterium]